MSTGPLLVIILSSKYMYKPYFLKGLGHHRAVQSGQFNFFNFLFLLVTGWNLLIKLIAWFLNGLNSDESGNSIGLFSFFAVMCLISVVQRSHDLLFKFYRSSSSFQSCCMNTCMLCLYSGQGEGKCYPILFWHFLYSSIARSIGFYQSFLHNDRSYKVKSPTSFCLQPSFELETANRSSSIVWQLPSRCQSFLNAEKLYFFTA